MTSNRRMAREATDPVYSFLARLNEPSFKGIFGIEPRTVRLSVRRHLVEHEVEMVVDDLPLGSGWRPTTVDLRPSM